MSSLIDLELLVVITDADDCVEVVVVAVNIDDDCNNDDDNGDTIGLADVIDVVFVSTDTPAPAALVIIVVVVDDVSVVVSLFSLGDGGSLNTVA